MNSEEVKESVEKLRQIKRWWRSGAISTGMAEELGAKHIEVYNKMAREVAKKYNTKPVLMKNLVLRYPE